MLAAKWDQPYTSAPFAGCFVGSHSLSFTPQFSQSEEPDHILANLTTLIFLIKDTILLSQIFHTILVTTKVAHKGQNLLE